MKKAIGFYGDNRYFYKTINFIMEFIKLNPNITLIGHSYFFPLHEAHTNPYLIDASIKTLINIKYQIKDINYIPLYIPLYEQLPHWMHYLNENDVTELKYRSQKNVIDCAIAENYELLLMFNSGSNWSVNTFSWPEVTDSLWLHDDRYIDHVTYGNPKTIKTKSFNEDPIIWGDLLTGNELVNFNENRIYNNTNDTVLKVFERNL